MHIPLRVLFVYKQKTIIENGSK